MMREGGGVESALRITNDTSEHLIMARSIGGDGPKDSASVRRAGRCTKYLQQRRELLVLCLLLLLTVGDWAEAVT